MSSTLTGVVVDGVIQLDQPANLPNQTHVTVELRPLTDEQNRRRDKFRAWLKFCRENPIHTGGQHFTREELYERD